MVSVRKSSNNLKTRIAERDRKEKNAPKARAKEKATVAASAAAKSAAQAAAAISQKKIDRKPIYKIDSAKCVGEGLLVQMNEHADWTAGSITSATSPLLITGSPTLQEWLTKPAVQLCTCNFAGTFLKDASKDPTGTTQRPLYAGQGHEEFTEFWDRVVKLFHDDISLDTKTLEPVVTSVLARTWQYGFTAERANMASVANGMAQFKCLYEGRVSWYAVAADMLSSAAQIMLGKDEVGFAEMLEMIENATVETLATLKSHGCSVIYVCQEKGQVVFLPAGWLAGEAVFDGVLVHGSRKSALSKEDGAARPYEALLGSYAADKKDIVKMQMVLKAMQLEED